MSVEEKVKEINKNVIDFHVTQKTLIYKNELYDKCSKN